MKLIRSVYVLIECNIYISFIYLSIFVVVVSTIIAVFLQQTFSFEATAINSHIHTHSARKLGLNIISKS